MAKTTQPKKYLTGMAGEFLVAAELNRRGIQAAVTYGSSKSADVFAINEDGSRAIRIEVKTTPLSTAKWVGLEKASKPENWRPNVFYVFVELPPAATPDGPKTEVALAHTAPRFYVLGSAELGQILQAEHEKYLAKFRQRHEREFTARGVPKLPKALAAPHQDRWDKIEKALGYRFSMFPPDNSMEPTRPAERLALERS